MQQDNIAKINNLLIREAERLDALNLKDVNYDREIDRAKALALTCCQYVAAESLVLKREMIKQNVKVIEYNPNDL